MGEQGLRWRLSRLVIASTVTALLVAALGFAAYEVTAFRRDLARRVGILADVAARNSAASLLFDDAASAETTLASLEADGELVLACVYDRDRATFARSRTAGSNEACPSVSAPGGGFLGDRYHVFHPVREESGEQIGWIYLEAKTQALTDRLMGALWVLVALILGSCGVALVLAAKLQRRISDPILGLAAASRAIAGGDLTTAVEVEAGDEIGTLGSSIANLGEKLRTLVGRIRRNSVHVAELTEALRTSSEQTLVEARAWDEATVDTGDALRLMTESIDDLHRGVSILSDEARTTANSTSQITRRTSEVAHHMDDLAASIEQSASAVTETSEALAAIGSTVETLHKETGGAVRSLRTLQRAAEEVGANAGEGRDHADQTVSEAQVAISSVRTTLSTMGDIRAAFEEVQSAVGGLSGKSEAIGGIGRVIDSVAKEIGLLALNAEIIASQAGEHGKAFSVVAGQVKSLADRTSHSANEIGELVQKVQAETVGAVALVDRGAQRVDEGVRRSDEAANVLERISGSAEAWARTAREITSATDSQGREIEAVRQAVGRVGVLVDEIRESAIEQGRASSEIAQTFVRISDLGREVKTAMQTQASDAGVIEAAFGRVFAMIEQSLDATESHKAAGQRVERLLALIRETGQATTARAAELSQKVALLSERSTELERAVDRFRV